MKKLIAFILAILIPLCGVFVVDYNIKCNINKKIKEIKYYNDHDKNYSDYVMEQCIAENDVLVLGSSELIPANYSIDEFTHPENLFNQGYSNYNLVLVGRGYCQNLQHAIDLGALDNNLKNKKVVLILSPQWFTEEQIPDGFFTRNFSDAQYIEFLENEIITLETRNAVAERVNEMMGKYPLALERTKLYQSVYTKTICNPISWLVANIYNTYTKIRHDFALYDYIKYRNVYNENNYVKIEDIDFDDLMKKAEEVGKSHCTNNEFGIFDEGYIDNIEYKLERSKNSETDCSYTKSKEFGDFELFLKVCMELDINPLVINVPVNGRWYDYTGFPKEDRTKYYQMTKDLCNKYGVEMADFSDKEYELYFLRDTMHLGWKGWVYVNEAIYNYYKEQ